MTFILAVSLVCVLIIAVFLAAGIWHVLSWCVRIDAEHAAMRARLHQLEAPDREVPLPSGVRR